MKIEEAFCACYACPASQYPERVFRLCLYAHAVPVAFALRQLSPALFRADQQVIQQVGLARDLEEVDAALSDFHSAREPRKD